MLDARRRIWALHIVALAPVLILFRGEPRVVLGLLLAMLAYHLWRLVAVHGCTDSYAQLNAFHIVFVFPLLYWLRGDPAAVALVAALMAAYFAANFGLRACRT